MPEESSYFAGVGDVREKMRVERQARILDRDINPLQGVELSNVKDVLGVGCGTGSWLIQYAHQHPASRVVGLDIDKGMLAFARAKAHVEGVSVDFAEGNALQPLKFADGNFDLVNMRMAIGFVRRDAWPPLLQECMRVLRPGGLIVLTEAEDTATNDYAYEKYGGIMCVAFHRVGNTFAGSPEQQHLCTGLALKKLLREAGFTDVMHRSYDVDFSYGEPAHAPILENVASAFENGLAFFVKYGDTTPEHIHEAESHIKSLINKPGFVGFWHFISAIGYKALILFFCFYFCYTAFIELSC